MLDGGCRRDHFSIALCRARQPRREQASTTLSLPSVTAAEVAVSSGTARSLGAYFSAISPRSRPSDDDSTASDLATNASGGVQADAAAGPRGAVGASAAVEE
jgi:hypothetical protein